jgi:hypothetical protein
LERLDRLENTTRRDEVATAQARAASRRAERRRGLVEIDLRIALVAAMTKP